MRVRCVICNNFLLRLIKFLLIRVNFHNSGIGYFLLIIEPIPWMEFASYNDTKLDIQLSIKYGAITLLMMYTVHTERGLNLLLF